MKNTYLGCISVEGIAVQNMERLFRLVEAQSEQEAKEKLTLYAFEYVKNNFSEKYNLKSVYIMPTIK